MTRTYSWPEDHWDWYQHLAFQHGIANDALMFVGGQVDKTSGGEPRHAFDLSRQTQVVMQHIDTVLKGFDSSIADVTKFTALYANDGSVDEQAFIADVGRQLLDLCGDGDKLVSPVITAVPLPCLALPGMMVEIEAVAVLKRADGGYQQRIANPAQLAPLPAPFSHGLRCGQHAWVGGQSGRDCHGASQFPGDKTAQTPLVMQAVQAVLAELGLDIDDTVKVAGWYRGDGRQATWKPEAQQRAAWFVSPGPVCTELPTNNLPDGDTVRVDVWAMRAPDGEKLERRHVAATGPSKELSYSAALGCDRMVFVGGQLPFDAQGRLLHSGDLNQQTRYVMQNIGDSLAQFGLNLDHMVRQMSFYLGGADPAIIVANQTLRSSYYTEPAGASTGVPLPGFAMEDVMVTVETIAMID